MFLFQEGNSLAGQELAVYSVTCGRSTPISFSVPVAAMAGPVAAALQDWGRQSWPDMAWNSSGTNNVYGGEVIQFNCSVKVLPYVAM
jgi:hypothetical protein